MRYNITIPGDGYVYVNGCHKVELECFIQTIRDVDKSNKCKFFGYGGE